jgi:diguanylate cyclase (GGDEF)-like protein
MLRSPRLLLLLLTFFVVALLAAAFALGWRTLDLEASDASRMTAQLDAATLGQEAKFLAADLDGAQNAYAFEIRRGNPAAASDKAARRVEFLRIADALKQKLVGFERVKLNADQRATLQSARASLERFMGVDAAIVGAYRSASEARVREGDQLVLGEAISAFRDLTQHLEALVQALQAHGAATGEHMADANRSVRHWLGLLASLSVALSAFLVFVVARTLAKHEALERQLDMLARTDALTGVANRRAWDEDLPKALQRSKRTQLPLCVVMVDLDYFKKFNDEHGHPAGDRLLSDMSAAFRAELREDDQIARYGGEEFALLLNGCDANQARAMLQRLSKVTPMQQTFSAGIVQCDGSEEPGAVVALADKALYQAKASGRRRAVIADTPTLALSASASSGKAEPKLAAPR